MKSASPKVLHSVAGRPMILYTVEAAEALSDDQPIVVVSPGSDVLRALLAERVLYAEQSAALGTGHATMMAAAQLSQLCETVVVTYADMPLMRLETLQQLVDLQQNTLAEIAVLTVNGDSSSTFGRICRGTDGRISEIVEVSEARLRPDGQTILDSTEHNAGVYAFKAEWLLANLDKLPLREARSGNEYYLTDLIGLAVEEGKSVETALVSDADECLGAGTRVELAVVESAMRRRINDHWLRSGVTIKDPNNSYIDHDVEIGAESTIFPGTHLLGETIIGASCTIGPNTLVRDSKIGARSILEQCRVTARELRRDSLVAPFSILEGEDEQ